MQYDAFPPAPPSRAASGDGLEARRKEDTVERRVSIPYIPPIYMKPPGSFQAFWLHKSFTNLRESSCLLMSFSTQHFETHVRGCLGPLAHGGSGFKEIAPEN